MGHDGFPSFSADGSRILFEAWDDYQYPEVFTMDPDGSNRVQLTNVPGADWQSSPVYAPDGSSIYFLKGFNADNHIVKMDLDGNNWVDITEPNVFGYAEAGLHFNSDGTKITFYTSEWGGYNGRTEIVVANADGSGWARLTNTEPNNVYNTSPVFNPADDLIYFVSNMNEDWHIFYMGTDGENIVQLTNCSPAGIFGTTKQSETVNCVPNPVEHSAVIEVTIRRPQEATAHFYDATGNRVELPYRILPSGVFIERGGLPSGIYFFDIHDGPEQVASGKVVLK
jgi:hypothetical protein